MVKQEAEIASAVYSHRIASMKEFANTEIKLPAEATSFSGVLEDRYREGARNLLLSRCRQMEERAQLVSLVNHCENTSQFRLARKTSQCRDLDVEPALQDDKKTHEVDLELVHLSSDSDTESDTSTDSECEEANTDSDDPESADNDVLLN